MGGLRSESVVLRAMNGLAVVAPSAGEFSVITGGSVSLEVLMVNE